MTNVAQKMGATDVSEVQYETGSSTMSPEQRKEIHDFVAKARERGVVDKIGILAWSDREYPQVKTKFAKSDIILSDRRIQDVENLIKNELAINSFDSYNMAERPTKLQNFFHTKDAKIKDQAEAGGAAPRTQEEAGIFNLKGQKAKAVIMVFLK